VSPFEEQMLPSVCSLFQNESGATRALKVRRFVQRQLVCASGDVLCFYRDSKRNLKRVGRQKEMFLMT
jgi:hypothetical protein